MKKQTKFILILVSIILLITLIVGILTFTKGETNTSYFTDANLGIIKIASGSLSWFQKLFTTQAITFTPSTAKVGDTISIRDDYTISTLPLDYKIYNWKFQILKDGVLIDENSGHFSQAKVVGDPLWITSSFIPYDTGTYSGKTYYYYATCVSPTSCINTGLSIVSSSINSVTVTDSQPSCTKQAYCGDWSVYQSITNGQVDKKTCYTVSSNCNYVNNGEEYRTSCNPNHRIVGTESSTSGSGQLQCEIIPIITPDPIEDCTINSALCLSTQNCDFTLKICIDKECNANEEITCNDGSKIITKECVSGVFRVTNNQCIDSIQKIKYFRFDGTDCKEIMLFSSEKTEADFLKLEECQANLPKGFDFRYLWILVLIIPIVLAIIFVFRIKKR